MKKVIIILALFSLYHYSYAHGRKELSSLKDTLSNKQSDPLAQKQRAPLAMLKDHLRDDSLSFLKADVKADLKNSLGIDPAASLKNLLQPADTIPRISDSLRHADSLAMVKDSLRHADSLAMVNSLRHADSLAMVKDSLRHADSLALVKASVPPTDPAPADTLEKPQGKTPRGAIIRSAIIPGWGQAYNNRYWKIPIVYGALGTTAAVFSYNMRYYKKIRFAYTTLINKDSANFVNVAPELQPFIQNNDIASLRLNRNTFRKNIDYSVLFFLFFWGLNVLDATVDAHLKGFNVNDDLSLKIKPLLDGNTAGLSLVLDIHKGRAKALFNNNNY